MTEKEIKEFNELLLLMPHEHPFELATLCKLYCYNDKPTYITNPSYNAFTYPEYNYEDMSFSYEHHDMESETMDCIRLYLIDIIQDYNDLNSDYLKNLVKLFNIPKEHIEYVERVFGEN